MLAAYCQSCQEHVKVCRVGNRAPAARSRGTGTQLPVEELLALLDWLPASVALWDADVRLRYGNRRALTRFGKPPAELLGARLSDVVQAHAVELSARYIDGALAGYPQQVERAMVDRDGQRYNAHQVTHIPNVVDGQLHGYCALAVDITASIDGYEQARRIRERAALREQGERIAGHLQRQRVVDDLCEAMERLDVALERAADAVPTVRAVANAIEHSIAELRATVPAQLMEPPGGRTAAVDFPAMVSPAAAHTGIPWPAQITGDGWTAEEACALLDLLPAEIALWDESLRNVFANRAAVRWFGRRSRDEVVGEHAQVLMGAEAFQAANVAYAEAVLLGEPRQFDRSVIHPGGLRHLQVYVAPRVRAGRSDGLYSVVIDVTSRVEAELALQEARAELATVRQRQRVADHLHNLVIQRLFAAELAATSAVAEAQVRSVQDNIVSALEDLEFAMEALRDNVPLVDLLPDLAHVVHDAADAAGIAVSIENVGSVEYVPPAIALELLAVTEDAVTNVAKHSRADSLVVTVAADAEGAWLRVADDGCGLGAARPRGGMADMLARAARLGGSCRWRAGPAGGTVVDFRVPLPS
jgi:PAS domain S-box-containing protein